MKIGVTIHTFEWLLTLMKINMSIWFFNMNYTNMHCIWFFFLMNRNNVSFHVMSLSYFKSHESHLNEFFSMIKTISLWNLESQFTHLNCFLPSWKETWVFDFSTWIMPPCIDFFHHEQKQCEFSCHVFIIFWITFEWFFCHDYTNFFIKLEVKIDIF